VNLALFDLDNTLLSGDSDYEWAKFLVDKGVVDAKTQNANNERFYAAYKAGTLDIDEFMSFQLAPLARHNRDVLEQWHAEFVSTRIRPLMSRKSRALVTRHLDAYDLCAVVTATNCFLAGAVVREYGITHLVSTIAATDTDGQFTGKPRGEPAFRDNKIVRVAAWLESLGLHWNSFARSFFYSDSLNDLPLMQVVTNPVAVDPDPTLAAHAEHCGWSTISLRDSNDDNGT